ncbi:MAG: glycosyltransferase family 4 protein [Chitinivibrionales bacterium]
MNIWLAASVPSKYFGGVNRNKLSFAAGLEERSHTVTTVFNDSHGFTGYPFVFPFRLCARLLFSQKRPDWIIARSFDGVFCALACRVFGLSTRTILHNHGWEEYVYDVERRLPAGLGAVPRTTWKAKLVRFPLLRLMLRACTVCMSGTLSEIRWIQTKYPPCRGKMRYVPNGVRPREYPFWERQTAWPLNFLCIGWFSWKKNLENTLDVFGIVHLKFPEAMLYIIGTGIHGVPEQVSQRKMEDCVFNIGDEGFEAMDTWYGRCPFLISSSRYEGGHSLAIIEAMSYGMVVFVSRIPQTTEFVRNGCNGVILDGCDAGANAEKMLPFITDKYGCIEIRRHAYATAMRNRWQRQVQRLARIIE